MANEDLNNVDMDALATALFSDANFGVNGGKVAEDSKEVSKKYNELTGKAEPAQQTGGSQWDDWFNDDDEDDSSEFYDNPVSFDDIKDELDPNNNTSDLTNGNEDSDEDDYDYLEPSDFFQRIPDDEVVFEGKTVGQLKALAKGSDETTEKQNFVKHHYEQLSNINGLSKSIIGKNMLETQKKIQGIERALNHPGTLAHQKGALYDDLQRETAKMREIERDWAQEEQASLQREKAAAEYGFFNVDQVMKGELGSQWDGNRLWNYVVRDRKIPVPTLEAIMRLPGGENFAKLAISSLENDIRNKRQDNAAKAIMSKKTTPKSVSTNKGKEVVKGDDINSRKNYLIRKERKVGLTAAEHREKYNYLVD